MHYIIAEKSTAAKRIASILSDGGDGETKKKKIGKVEAYEIDEKIVIGLKGHVVGFDFSKNYSNWVKIEPYELINAEIVAKPLREDIVEALERIAKDADEITIATDYDREGELIGVEALSFIKNKNPLIQVNRMRYSAITERAIKESFANRTSIDYNLAISAEAREIIDLIWGASLTRFISLSANQVGENFLSAGRVQSPTLSILVDKEKEIENFVPSKYWRIHAKIRTEKGEILDIEHKKGRFKEKILVEDIKAKIEEEKVGFVKGVEKTINNERPPIPFDTTEFIKDAALLKFSPMKAMRIAESLYLKGLISYHRTDNTVYPDAIDVKALVKMFLENDDFEEYAKEILKKKEIKPTAGKKKSHDHPPIHPVSAISAEEKRSLSEEEQKIYEIVVRRFLATLSDIAKWEKSKVVIEIGGEIFKGEGRELKQKGYLAVYPYQKKEEKMLPKLKIGEKVGIEGVEIVEKKTEPPNRLSSSALIKKMEKLGLGTKSTRHEIINKLYARAYVQGNPLKPTNKASAIIDALRKYGLVITKPEMTAELENKMDAISEGKIKKEIVVENSKRMLTEVFKGLIKNREEIAKMIKEGLKSDKIIGFCPKCNKELLLRASKGGKRFIGCSNYPSCKFSLPLPKNKSGRLLITDDKCPEHALFKIKVIGKGKGKRKAWELGCPYCNFLQWQNKKQKEE